MTIPLNILLWSFLMAFSVHIVEESTVGGGFVQMMKKNFWHALGLGRRLPETAFSAKRFRSNWMAVIVHGEEGILVHVTILTVTLGMKPG